jgi:hypothetical protein
VSRDLLSESFLFSAVLVVSLSNLLDWDLFPVFFQVFLAVAGLLVYGRTLLVKVHEGGTAYGYDRQCRNPSHGNRGKPQKK